MKIIDLRSDTVTQPTDEMRKAMYEAVVGDDVYEDDPTVKELEALAAQLSGKEEGLFVPSGTFGNQLCLLTHTNRGDEVLVGNDSHILMHEVGASAVIAGVQLRTFKSDNCSVDAEEIRKMIREDDIHYPGTALICLENALGSGAVLPLESMKEVKALADEFNVPVHLDGARVFNAAKYLGVNVREIMTQVDSCTFCLSKGLCAPIGSMVVGDKAFIAKARKNRKLMGGGLRQAGHLAAAGIIALNDMVERLEEDHENLQYLARELDAIEGIDVIWDRTHINMVFFKMPESIIEEKVFIASLLEKGIKINGTEEGEYRFVTNHDVNKEDLDKVIEVMVDML